MALIDKEIKKNLGWTDPLSVLNSWLKEALQIKSLKEPWAMTLSTSHKDQVSSRVLLLKQIQKDKLIFYSNYLSDKGRDLSHNPYSALSFYWPQLRRQIRIEGIVKKTSRRQSIRYWKSRSRASQISQWISRQSEELSSRKQLENLKKQAERKFLKKPVPCPPQWGGYALQIRKIEFWRERAHRLHDRFLFEKSPRGWQKQRLFP